MINTLYKDILVKEVPPGTNQELTFAVKYPLDILIAEDNFVNQKLIERVLQKLGYQTDTAADGMEVLDFLAKKRYNVILMDVRMPEMDGYEATVAIRKMNIIQPFIIAMTANVSTSDREDCFEAGMNDFIPKPISIGEVTSKLQIASACFNLK